MHLNDQYAQAAAADYCPVSPQRGFGTNSRKSRNGADQYACRDAPDG